MPLSFPSFNLAIAMFSINQILERAKCPLSLEPFEINPISCQFFPHPQPELGPLITQAFLPEKILPNVAGLGR